MKQKKQALKFLAVKELAVDLIIIKMIETVFHFGEDCIQTLLRASLGKPIADLQY